jgi:hypothetical protein
MIPKKPVIVMTVYRRYHELEKNIDNIYKLSSEFQTKPDIVIVWAQPEVSRLWFFQYLLSSKKISYLITRPRLDCENPGCATTYPESVSIRLGLDFVRNNYDASFAYIILQCADITPREGLAYSFIDKSMNEGASAVLFHWENSCIRHGVWHSNFFAVSFDDQYWPPVSDVNDDDVLERQWGKLLDSRGLSGVVKSHNYQNKKFFHTHESEHLPEYPRFPQADEKSVSLSISGHLPWYARLYRCIFPFRR